MILRFVVFPMASVDNQNQETHCTWSMLAERPIFCLQFLGLGNFTRHFGCVSNLKNSHKIPGTPRKTNSLHLKMGAPWKRRFRTWKPSFLEQSVSFRGGVYVRYQMRIHLFFCLRRTWGSERHPLNLSFTC